MNEDERRTTDNHGTKLNEDFRAAFARLLAEERRANARGALAILFCTALATFSLLLMAGAPLRGWRFFPLFSFIFFWSAVAVAALAIILKHLLPVRGDRRLAGELDERLGGGNLLEAALEFSKAGERTRVYSPFLLAATVSRAKERIRGIDPRELFASAGRPSWTAAGTLVGILVAVQIAFLGGDPGVVLDSIADPGRAFRFPFRYNLIVTSGDRLVLPGESVVAEAMNFGGMRGDAALLVSAIPGVWNRVAVRGEALTAEGMGVSVYRHRFNDIREDFVYSFSAGGARTPDYRVTVIHRPVINRMAAVLKPPLYTGAKSDTLDPLAGKIAALRGTRVEIEGETSKSIRDGQIRFGSGLRVPLAGAAHDGALFRGAFTITVNDTFAVEIVDSLGFANDRTVQYAIAALDDGAPSIDLLAPEDGAQLPRTLATDVIYRASDDYGLARVTLYFLRDGKDERYKAVPLTLPPARPLVELEGRIPWSLAEENVFPGDKILYYLEAVDNNTASGPGSARTETRRLVVPSLSEIYARIHEEDSRRREDLEDVLDKGREIRERVKKLSDELKAEGDLDWSRRREGGEILEKQRELKDKMQAITSQIDQSLETIEKNRAASQEVGSKVEEIQKLLQRIESEELRKTIENLQKLMSEAPTKELMSAMNEIELDVEKLLENLDRTIELLKQVVKEEKMDELVRRMDEMLKEQTAIRDSTPRGDTEELSKKQDELGKESKEYEEQLEKFTEEQKSDSSLAAELEKALKEMEQSKLCERMDQAADQLSSSDRSAAQRTQKSVIDDMLNLFTQMSSCRMSMGIAMEKEVAETLARSARELIEASKLQEKVAPTLPGSGRTATDELVREELVVKTAVEQISKSIYQAARRTMALSPKIFINLGNAQKEIDAALGAMEEERMLDASEASARAYRSMNIATIELLRASVSSGGSSSGARTRMQQLLQQQTSLSRELQRMLERGKSGRWTMEERAGMARLAAEQRKMEDVMKQISEESGGTHDLMGKLDDLAGAMEEIARNLEEGKLDQEILDRQEQILTRLLESQRSMRERDYKKERTSATAGDVKPLAPDTWEKEVNDREVLLRMIRRSMQEKGPAEYEELIRRYFRALSEKAREGQ